jgi:hypothetical protein
MSDFSSMMMIQEEAWARRERSRVQVIVVSTHDIAVRRPRHDVPFDGNVPVRVQRVVSH